MQMKTGGAPARGPVRQVMWLAMVASVFVYGAITFVVTGNLEPRPAPIPGWALPVIAAVLAAVALVLHRRMGESAAVDRDRPAPPIRPLEVQVWALDEAVAVLGLVGAILTMEFAPFTAYAVVSLVLLVLHRPQ